MLAEGSGWICADDALRVEVASACRTHRDGAIRRRTAHEDAYARMGNKFVDHSRPRLLDRLQRDLAGQAWKVDQRKVAAGAHDELGRPVGLGRLDLFACR